MSVRILHGDCREMLKSLPDESVHCCVTSPPYWGLRDYGVDGQLGLERTLGEHVETMVSVFREVRRVLRKDGTCWVNYGDSYAASVNGRSAADTKAAGNDDRTFRDKPFSTVGPIWRAGNPDKNGGRSNRNGVIVESGSILKPKDLCGVPWRVAFALQEDGWWLRQDIIWSKPNPMPESVRDRCTKAHEYIFLLSKSASYYYDADAIAETSLRAGDIPKGSHKHTSDSVNDGRIRQGLAAHSLTPVAETRNKRSVWDIATSPYSDAHFATFPPALIEPCIKAGTSEKGCCAKCGAPWVRDVERKLINTEGWGKATKDHHAAIQGSDAIARNGQGRAGNSVTTTLGWSPSCKCYPPLEDAPACFVPRLDPCTVLDPFGGAGTTGLVADRLQRNAILIELNPEYASMADRRIFNDAPLFAEAAE